MNVNQYRLADLVLIIFAYLQIRYIIIFILLCPDLSCLCHVRLCPVIPCPSHAIFFCVLLFHVPPMSSHFHAWSYPLYLLYFSYYSLSSPSVSLSLLVCAPFSVLSCPDMSIPRLAQYLLLNYVPPCVF